MNVSVFYLVLVQHSRTVQRFLNFSGTVSSVMSLFPLDQSLGLLFLLIITGFWSQPWLLGILIWYGQVLP